MSKFFTEQERTEIAEIEALIMGEIEYIETRRERLSDLSIRLEKIVGAVLGRYESLQAHLREIDKQASDVSDRLFEASATIRRLMKLAKEG